MGFLPIFDWGTCCFVGVECTGCVFWKLSPVGCIICKYFLLVLMLSLYFMVSFAVQKLVSLIEFYLLTFAFISTVLLVLLLSKKILVQFMLKNVLLVF